MRAPPENRNRNARLAPGVGKRSAIKNWNTSLDSQSLANPQAIFTAVPAGLGWRVKVLSPNGEATLLGEFDGRLPALGAALLMSAQAGGRAMP